MRHRYAKERLRAAVRSMAVDNENMKTRVWNAYVIFHTLSEKDFSKELQEDWNFIYQNLTTEDPSYNEQGEIIEGRVQNSLKTLSEDKCLEIARRIVALETKVCAGNY